MDDYVEQLAGEDGVDGLAVALGEDLQGQGLEAGDADFEAGEAEELGDGIGRGTAPRALASRR